MKKSKEKTDNKIIKLKDELKTMKKDKEKTDNEIIKLKDDQKKMAEAIERLENDANTKKRKCDRCLTNHNDDDVELVSPKCRKIE